MSPEAPRSLLRSLLGWRTFAFVGVLVASALAVQWMVNAIGTRSS